MISRTCLIAFEAVENFLVFTDDVALGQLTSLSPSWDLSYLLWIKIRINKAESNIYMNNSLQLTVVSCEYGARHYLEFDRGLDQQRVELQHVLVVTLEELLLYVKAHVVDDAGAYVSTSSLEVVRFELKTEEVSLGHCKCDLIHHRVESVVF